MNLIGSPFQIIIGNKGDGDTLEFKETGNIRGLDHIGLAGGSILEDFDNDNDLDLIASSWGADDQLQYFENDGKGYFSNKTNIILKIYN